MISIGKRIQDLRKANNLSQLQLEDTFNTSIDFLLYSKYGAKGSTK